MGGCRGGRGNSGGELTPKGGLTCSTPDEPPAIINRAVCLREKNRVSAATGSGEGWSASYSRVLLRVEREPFGWGTDQRGLRRSTQTTRRNQPPCAQSPPRGKPRKRSEGKSRGAVGRTFERAFCEEREPLGWGTDRRGLCQSTRRPRRIQPPRAQLRPRGKPRKRREGKSRGAVGRRFESDFARRERHLGGELIKRGLRCSTPKPPAQSTSVRPTAFERETEEPKKSSETKAREVWSEGEAKTIPWGETDTRNGKLTKGDCLSTPPKATAAQSNPHAPMRSGLQDCFSSNGRPALRAVVCACCGFKEARTVFTYRHPHNNRNSATPKPHNHTTTQHTTAAAVVRVSNGVFKKGRGITRERATRTGGAVVVFSGTSRSFIGP